MPPAGCYQFVRMASGGQAQKSESARTPSVTELEHSFAQDPQSEVYIALCEAYLDLGRFMEAMVVCKKGLKAHPDSVEARVLLARVYTAQQKYSRALQELDELIKSRDDSAVAYLARAKVRVSSGDDKGAVNDLKASVDRDKDGSAEATKLLLDRGIEYPEKPPPAPPPPDPPPMAAMPANVYVGPVSGTPMVGVRPSMAPPAFGNPGVGTPGPGTLPPLGTPGVGTLPPLGTPGMGTPGIGSLPPLGTPQIGSLPTTFPPGQTLPPGATVPPRPQLLEGEEKLEKLAEGYVQAQAQAGRGGNPMRSVMLAAGLLVIVLAVTGYRVYQKRVAEGIEALSKSAQGPFHNDTYGGYKKAAADYQRIINEYKKKHDVSVARIALINVILFGEHGDTDARAEIASTVERAEKLAPGRAETLAARGLRILYEGKKSPKAAADALAAIDADAKAFALEKGPGGPVDIALGIIHLSLGNYDTALETLRVAKDAQQQSSRAKVWFARAAYRAGRLNVAENAFSSALRAADHPGARAGRALVRLRQGDLDGAADDIVKFDEFEKEHGKEVSAYDRAAVYFARSEVFRAAGSDEKAEGAYEQATRYDDTNPDFPHGKGKSLLSQGRGEEALPSLKKAVQMEPNRRAFLVTLAECLLELDNLNEAKVHIDKALASNPHDLEAAIAKAQLMRRQGIDAEAYLLDVIKWSNGDLRAILELARTYRQKDRLDAARQTLEKASEDMGRFPQTQQAQVFLDLGNLLREVDDDKAFAAFKKAADLGATEAWYRIAKALDGRGSKKEKEQFKDACERYLQAGPTQRFYDQAQRLCAGVVPQ
ncbi:MAG: tetratricopeptide repeat protein [Deltaproteobacteria bacterium]|nr:tetratricopeptide repeat protein [Deltaproteobacteria bacterium]